MNTSPVRWDPYDPAFFANPYPTYARLRDESPLYYNEQYDFYAVSRYEDVRRGLLDRDTFISGRGAILEFIKANAPVPSGVFIFEDPPLHTVHCGLLNRVFTPKKMTALEPLIRQYCAKALDPLVEGGRFDFVADLGAQMPMRVIGMLLGIPEEDQQAVRRRADSALITEAGKPMDFSEHSFVGEGFEEYLDWRAKHPSDDLMTELVNAEFEDETGTTRRLSRDEVLIFVNIIASAGNETTNRLIGWTGKVLAEHPDQRRQIYQDRELIPQTIEEVLRYEPPPPHIARYVARDTEFYGTKVPAGSAILFLVGAANRDERKFADGERFDIQRARLPHLTFGNGAHSCIGNALARVEGRVALDELLNRFPEWNVELDKARLSCTSTVRGWETLPAYTLRANDNSKARPAESATALPGDAVRLAGAEVWKLTLKTPMGPQEMSAQIVRQGDGFTGRIDSPMGSEIMKNGKIAGDTLTWTMEATKPIKIKLSFEAKVVGDKMTGKAKLGLFGSAALTGQRV